MHELSQAVKDATTRLQQLTGKFQPDKKRQTLRRLKAKSADPNFWSDTGKAKLVSQQVSQLEKELATLESIQQQLADLAATIDAITDEAEFESFKPDLTSALAKANKSLDALELKLYLSGPYDANSAILTLHAGQGGVEAMDWTQMLLRMYLRFCQRQDWPAQLVEEIPGEEAGIKSASILVNASYAYGHLKHEAGTHRLVRLSPFNADHLRQTSFAKLEVLPQLPDDSDIKLDDKDIKFESFRSSGHGGQNVNKVSTAVRLTHLPTGLIAECQTQRYQEQNRKIATQLLTAKLWDLRQQQRRRQTANLKGGQKHASWGTQIRSYVLHPYKQVKDLRTKYESKDPEAVLDGDILPFIEASLISLNTSD